MTVRIGLAALTAILGAAPVMAQGGSPTSTVVQNAMFAQSGGRYAPPDKGKHFKTSSANTYLKSAIEAGAGEKATDLLGSGHRVVLEAITQEGQEKSTSAWYTAGRIDLFQGDIVGADSALRRAEALGPDCKSEIELLRRTAYAALANEGAKAAEAKNSAGAIRYYNDAARVYPSSAFVPYNLGALYAEANQPDSAIKYFSRAAASTSADTNEVKIKRIAEFNAAVLMLNNGQAAEAVPLLEGYVARNPTDNDAKRGLASAYRSTGQTEKARALDAQTGVSTASGPSVNAGVESALALYREKKYPEAAAAFEQIIAAEPYNVTALAAQSNAYLAMKDGPKLSKSASQLAAVEPLNFDALKLQREGHRLAGETDKANASAEARLRQPTSVAVTSLTLAATSAKLTGAARGEEALDAKTGKGIAPKAVSLVFEFLDKTGAVVATQEVAIPALPKDQTHEFSAEGKGEGIVAYRYKVKA
jgi:tetratricopeptide (TPR) repeat protein